MAPPLSTTVTVPDHPPDIFNTVPKENLFGAAHTVSASELFSYYPLADIQSSFPQHLLHPQYAVRVHPYSEFVDSI